MTTPSSRCLRAGLLGFALLAISSESVAQEQPAIPLNRFNPAPAGDRFFGVDSAYPGEHLTPHARLLFDYAHNPLVVSRANSDDRVGEVVEHQLFAHLGGSLGLFDWLSLNLEIPVALYQGGSDVSVGSSAFSSPETVAFGDLRVGLRGRILGAYDDAFQVGVGGYLWLPTGSGDDGSFVSSGSVRGMPKLLLGGMADWLVWSATFGAEIKESAEFGGTSQGSLMHWGLAAGALVDEDKRIQIGPEINISMTPRDPDKRNTNAEGLLGAKWRFIDDMEAGIGAGMGFTSGVGTPDFRSVLSIAYTPLVGSDRDHDGIKDGDDACPSEAGKANADPAKHGCPADRDGDGIIDREDSCPDVKGQPNADPAKHGCPLDADGDGIVDEEDACPTVKGAANVDPAKHGCPLDSDGDGILDGDDACPETAGEAHDDPAKHGCPPDRDGDGIEDKLDACPDVVGVRSDDPAKHGCPLDSDGDGIFDSDDACPKQPGKANADPAKHGCPKVIVTEGEIKILERVEFASGKSVIRKVSNDLVDQIAQVLKDHPEILKVEVQGHTDDRGNKFFNKLLSKRRAAAVVRALIKRGIDRKRLTSKGFGQDEPIAGNDTDEGRQKNRRVQLNILERKKK